MLRVLRAKARKTQSTQRVSIWLRLGGAAMTRSIPQNLKRSVVCMLRMALTAAGNPNCVLVTVVFQLVKVAWLRKFVESNRKSRLNRPRRRNVRPMEAFKVN